MRLVELDPVVLDVGVPEHGLPKRSLGAVVHLYTGDACEVEFVTASGRTAALVTLKRSQLRRATDDDLVCVSRMAPPADSLSARRPRHRQR
jgi:Domain of unknown function (DUF4926)